MKAEKVTSDSEVMTSRFPFQKIRKNGGIIIPKEILKQMNMKPGDSYCVIPLGEGSVQIRTVHLPKDFYENMRRQKKQSLKDLKEGNFTTYRLNRKDGHQTKKIDTFVIREKIIAGTATKKEIALFKKLAPKSSVLKKT